MIIGSFPSQRDLRFARTQREAGLADADWENRLPRLRSWMDLAVIVAAWVGGLAAMVFLTAFTYGAP